MALSVPAKQIGLFGLPVENQSIIFKSSDDDYSYLCPVKTRERLCRF